MARYFSFLSYLLITSLTGYGQDNQNYDSLKLKCEGPVFTLCEQMPELRYGLTTLGDSLNVYLSKRNLPAIQGVAKFRLTILRTGEIENISVVQTDIDDKNIIDIIEKALRELTNRWIPGKQNGYPVCVYRKILLYFMNDEIEISLPKF